MGFWKKKENLIISAAVLVFFIGLAFWPNICALRAAFQTPFAPSSVTRISFSNEQGDSVTLEKFKGQPLIVNFWATWCPVCVKNMSSFNAFAKTFESQGGKVISISEDNDIGTVKAYLARKGYANLPAHLDHFGQLMAAYGVAGLPTTIFIDESGNEIERITGGVDWKNPTLVNWVSKLFGM